MKILSFSDTRFPIERANGVQTMATCHALAARGHDVHLVVRPDVVTPPRDPFEFYGWTKQSQLLITRIGGPRRGRARRARFLLGVLRMTTSEPADVIYTRDLGVAAFLLRWPPGRRPPIVYESHGIASLVSAELPMLLGKPELEPSPQKLARLDRRERRVWQHAAAYVTITAALRDELAKRFGSRDRVFVIPDGARLEDERHGDGTISTGRMTPCAAYAGHLYPWKGVDVFVRALAATPGIRGLIVGGHPDEEDAARVDRLIRDLGIGSRVEVTGLVPPSDVRRRLAAATILVLPNTATTISDRYTSPLKLFEYLTLGRPIVASDLPAIREVLTHRHTALLVPPDDPAALATALSRLTSDAGLAAALGAAARELAPAYTWERRAERLDNVLAALRIASR